MSAPLKQGGEAASRLVHTQEIAGSSPAPATSALVTGSAIAIQLCDASAMLLRLIAAHDGQTPAALLDRLIVARAEDIGVPELLDGASPNSELAE